MIKLNKYLYIHWLFVLLLVFAYINRNLELMMINFLVVSLHELAHLVAAKCLGLTVSHIIIYPFGLNLRLKNTILYSISDEIILYMAGPVLNAVFALACVFLYNYGEIFKNLYYINIALFITNILPVMPLDGGAVVKKLLNYRFGFQKGNLIMRVISFIMLSGLTAGAIMLIYTNNFNPSICIFSLFLLGNVLISKEKYNKNLLKELLYCRSKKNNKAAYGAKIVACNGRENLLGAVKHFNQADNYFVFVTDGKKVKSILSEEEVIDSLLMNNNAKKG